MEIITYKTCNKCNQSKLISEYGARKTSRDGTLHACKKCIYEIKEARMRTKEGLIIKIALSQKNSSLRRGHKLPSYSKDELLHWVFSQRLFHKIYDEWVGSGYEKELIPSIDRIKNDLPYSFDNIQLMTWKENMAKFNNEMRIGVASNGTPHKKVDKLTLSGEFIRSYVSISAAARDMKKSASSISSCCAGNVKKTCGYQWRYHE